MLYIRLEPKTNFKSNVGHLGVPQTPPNLGIIDLKTLYLRRNQDFLFVKNMLKSHFNKTYLFSNTNYTILTHTV